MSKRTGRKPKRERTSRRRTRRHSSTSETSSEDVPPPKVGKTRATSRVDEGERKVALTIKLPKPESTECIDGNTTGMWKVECSNGSDGDIQKLKISLRRSPKDLLREQAAEAKYSAERKEKEEATGSSTNPSMLDGSVTNYLEQFGSTMAVEESEQNIVDSSEQVQVVIPPNEPSCNQENIDDDQVDSVEVSSEFITPDEEPIVENVSTDEQLIDAVVSVSKVENNEIHEEVLEPADTMVESANPINSSKDFPGSIVRPPIDECDISEPVLEENCVTTEEVIDIPIALSEKIQDVVPESIENIVNEPEVLETASNVEMNKNDNPIQKQFSKPDEINDSEQMEDVVQLTVESPDLVDDEDSKPIDEETKLVNEEEPKPVYEEESNSANVNETESDNGIESKSLKENEFKLVDREENPPIEESYKVLSLDVPNIKQVDDEKELNEMPKLLSSHPKRKWGSCKTRTPITISPFTLGTIIESNGDSIADNGEYRSEEGEIQKTDSDDEQDVEEAMELDDTMLIDHEAVDYEAPEEEERHFIDNDDNKSDKSLAEEINEVDTKTKTSVKRITTTSIIRITNLVRPFTVGQLRDLLQRTGKIVSNGFWIDTIKSQCIVEYENEDQAIETVYALNDSQWPSTNPKFLRVVFTNKEELNKALSGTHPDRLDKKKESKVEKLRTQVENNFILREWDRGKLEDMNGDGEKDDKPIKRKISDDLHATKDKKLKKDEKDLQDKRKKSKSKTPDRIPTKSLDELFRKTKTTPTLYWSPLSIEQIAEKEDQRRKHLAEMERSQKTDRRRRGDNLHYPKRR